MDDTTEDFRRVLVNEINSDPSGRSALEKEHGQVWDTTELSRDYEVKGFMAPYVVVKRKSDGAVGSLLFQHSPRYYFSFTKN
jgi:hypothetical protein